MLGRSTTPHSPAAATAARHQSLAPHVASRRLQPCLLPPGALIQRCQQPSSSPSQQPVQSLCTGLAPASSSSSRPPTQQQQQHLQHQHNSSCSHVVRVVSLQQDDSFSPEKQQGACFSSPGSSSQDVLDVVPEAGVCCVQAYPTPPRQSDRLPLSIAGWHRSVSTNRRREVTCSSCLARCAPAVTRHQVF